jgi:N-terminal acetyltransferase B complex non-catalytic subunit
VQKLQKNDSGDCVRGPHLAIIEIERQHRLNGNTKDRKFVEALANYFQRFVWVHLLSVCVHLESIYTLYYL